MRPALRIKRHTLCATRSALCPERSALCAVGCAFNALRSALCALPFNRSTQTLAIGIILLLAPLTVAAKQEQLIQGRTMGTTYHVTVVTGYSQGITGLKEKIDQRLDEINRSMSTYLPDSEISRFNAFQRAGERFEISPDFFEVIKVARKVFELSGGAWDGTVNPLVDLWGFGPTQRPNRIPPKEEISARLAAVGFANIDILAPGILVKKRAAVSLDLSSIAKGFGVDQLAAMKDLRIISLKSAVRFTHPAFEVTVGPGAWGSTVLAKRPPLTMFTGLSSCMTEPLPPAAITAIFSRWTESDTPT